MEYVYVAIALFTALAVLGLLAYLIVNHKISTAGVTATLTGIRDQLHQVHTSVQTRPSPAPAAGTVAGTPAIDFAPTAQPAAAPAAPAAVVAPAPPATPAGEPDAQKITRLIGVWRALGVPWREVGLQLQTGFGLGRALTAADWNTAIAAGMPAELLQVQTSPPENNVTVWLPIGGNGFNAAFDRASGAWLKITGNGFARITVPVGFVGRIWPCANVCPGTVYPVKTTVNHGDEIDGVTDAEQAHKMLVFGDTPGPNEVAGTAGQDVDINVEQAAASSYLAIFYVLPKAA